MKLRYGNCLIGLLFIVAALFLRGQRGTIVIQNGQGSISFPHCAGYASLAVFAIMV